ncbi:MAG: hypothetical protein WAT37_18615 [Saprospiraceae bacterium]
MHRISVISTGKKKRSFDPVIFKNFRNGISTITKLISSEDNG